MTALRLHYLKFVIDHCPMPPSVYATLMGVTRLTQNWPRPALLVVVPWIAIDEEAENQEMLRAALNSGVPTRLRA